MNNNLWFLPKGPNTIRILIHAINHVGLGHINRSIAVAQWLKAAIPDVQVLFLVEGGEHFIEPSGFPWILIPNQSSENEHCEQITRTVLDVFRPTLSIHESVLRECIHRPVRDAGVKQVLMGSMGGGVMRDQFQNGLANVNEVDLVIVLQQKEEVQPSEQALIAQYNGKTLYAGPLVRRKDRVSSDALRKKLGLKSDDKVILATFGGGGWDIATVMLANLLAAREQILDRYPQTKLIVVSGPHFSGELPKADEFVCYASRFEPFLTDYINIASTIVSMAGYSTVNEIAASGIPAICVPSPEAGDQVGRGGMAEYAQSFPNITAGSADELVPKVIETLGKKQDLSATQAFWRRAERASQSIVNEIKCLLENTI